MHRVLISAICTIACLTPALSQAAVSMGVMEENSGGMINFDTFGQVNPVYNVGGTTVSFGSAFEGQVLGSMHNELIDSSPSSPLRLDANAPDVSTLFEITAGDIVLGGSDDGTFLTTPLAVLFKDPVKDVYFDLGHLDAPSTVRVEAYDADGQSLGIFGNPSAGWQTIEISDSSKNSISGLSIFVPEGGMDWEGFAIDNLGFRFSDDTGSGGGGPDPPVVPEPSSFLVWGGLGLLGFVGVWFKGKRPIAN